MPVLEPQSQSCQFKILRFGPRQLIELLRGGVKTKKKRESSLYPRKILKWKTPPHLVGRGSYTASGPSVLTALGGVPNRSWQVGAGGVGYLSLEHSTEIG
jgi:hypothetical protein